MEARGYPPPGWVPSLFDGLVSRSSGKADPPRLTHAHSCCSTYPGPQSYPSPPFLPDAAALKPSISTDSALVTRHTWSSGELMQTYTRILDTNFVELSFRNCLKRGSPVT